MRIEAQPQLLGPALDRSEDAAIAAIRRVERYDVLALLERRIANAAAVARGFPEREMLAEDRRRQFEVLRDEIKAGMHIGAASIALELAVEPDEIYPAPSGEAPTGGMTPEAALVQSGPEFRSPRALSRGEGGRPESAGRQKS